MTHYLPPARVDSEIVYHAPIGAPDIVLSAAWPSANERFLNFRGREAQFDHPEMHGTKRRPRWRGTIAEETGGIKLFKLGTAGPGGNVNNVVLRITALVVVAVLLINKKQFPESQAELQEAERLMPDSYLPHLNRGHLFYAQGRYDDASREYQEALRREPSNTALVQLLARQYAVMGPPDRAEDLYRRAIALTKSQSGQMDPQAAKLTGELAQYLAAHRQYDKAKPLFLEAIKILGQSGHPEDNGLQTVLDEYNAMLRAAGEGGAQQEATGAVPGAPAPSANPEKNWTISMEGERRAMMANKLDEAERMYRQAVEDAGKLPPQDFRPIMTLRDLTGLYMRQGKYSEAEEPLKRALQLSEQNFGEKSSQVAEVLADLAQLHVMQKDYKSVERFAARSLKIREQTPGTAPPIVTQALDMLANICYAGKQFDKAEPLYRRALALTEQSQGSEDFSVTVYLDHLAAMYVAQGQFAKAEPLYRRGTCHH